MLGIEGQFVLGFCAILNAEINPFNSAQRKNLVSLRSVSWIEFMLFQLTTVLTWYAVVALTSETQLWFKLMKNIFADYRTIVSESVVPKEEKE
jgi:hypothetical protein